MKTTLFSLLALFSIAAATGTQPLSSTKEPTNSGNYSGAADIQNVTSPFDVPTTEKTDIENSEPTTTTLSINNGLLNSKKDFKNGTDSSEKADLNLKPAKVENFTTKVSMATASSDHSNKRSTENDQFANSTFLQMPPVMTAISMSNISDPLEFLEKFGLQEAPSAAVKTAPADDSQTTGPKSSLLERTIGYPFAPSASCSPQPTTVPITFSSNPFDIYFPSCTRVDRCGGCCSHDLLECAPLTTETAVYQVLKTRYIGPPINKFDVSETVTVEIEKHLECQCQCRVKATDCKSNQIYRPNECRCECMNQDDVRRCVGDKLWDPSACLCRCREIYECSTGFAFNLETCKCEAKRVTRMGFGPAYRGFDEAEEE
ncbi:hypothetical protein CHUAL_007505 [Chamberlinius hualienensis]